MLNRGELLGSLTQFPVKKDVATWRQEEVTVKGNELKTVTFTDSKPNMFFVHNSNDVYLLVGITKTPSEKSYEWRIEKNNSQTFGRPVPTNVIHFLNPSNKDITITMFSVYDKFDINVLKNMMFTGDIVGDIVNDGIIKGFLSGVSLPSGTNTIGAVHVASMPTLSAGSNHIGEVSLDSESVELLQAISEKLTPTATTDLLFYEETVTTEINFANEDFVPNHMNYISNDGETDISVTLIIGDNSRIFTLKTGEVFSDVQASFTGFKIEPKNDGEEICFRAMFSARG